MSDSGIGHGIAMGLSDFCFTHIYIEFVRLQNILMLLQNLLRFLLCFAPHLSHKALFNLWHPSAHPSWPYSSQTSIAPGKARQACGILLFLCFVILPGRTWPGSCSWLLGCLWKQRDGVRLPNSVSSQTRGGEGLHFWAYNLHHHHSPILKIILFSPDSLK